MASTRKKSATAKIWSVESKAPTLVSLSVRDQNIPRPPKRSSSLKAAASSLKQGLSSSHLLHPNSQAGSLKLRRGQHQSCSSLQVSKTRHKPIEVHMMTIEDKQSRESSSSHRSGAVSSDGTLFDVVEHYWDNLCSLPHLPRRAKDNRSNKAVLHSEIAHQNSASSGTLNTTYGTAPRSRQQAERRLVSRMFHSLQHNVDAETTLQKQELDRVEAWVEDAIPDICSQLQRKAELRRQDDLHVVDSGAKALSPENSPIEAPPVVVSDELPDREPSARASDGSHDTGSQRIGHPVRLRVSAKAELTEATLTSAQAVWAVAQIRVEIPPCCVGALAKRNSIAVAIVLDNSRMATRKDMKKACLEIMSLAASMDEGVDHVGVYCTSGAKLSDTCLLSIAVPLNLASLCLTLDQVPTRPRDCFCVQDAFLQAAQALRTLRAQDHHAIPRIKADIIVITPDALSLSQCLEEDLESFRVHLANPNLIPYSKKVHEEMAAMRSLQLRHIKGTSHISKPEQHCSHLSGWLIDSARCLCEDADTYGRHTLTDVIQHARAQMDNGVISNVSIRINETDDAIIEEINGDLSHATLTPGQILSVPVRVRMESLEQQLSADPAASRSCTSQLSMLESISELELTLGNHLSELFEVQVTYNHSFFPSTTRLEVRESCWLPRYLPVRKSIDVAADGVGSIKNNTRVQKQLALCIASSRPPKDALYNLVENFPAHKTSGSVSSFLDALQRQLKHRIALYADVSFMDYMLATQYAEASPAPNFPTSDGELSETCVTLSDISLDEHCDDTPKTIVRRRIPAQLPSTVSDEGEARRIWQHIRRTSRRGQYIARLPEEIMQDMPINDQGSDAEKHDPYIEQIREAAKKHGRKISSATLRSLAKDFKRIETSFAEDEELELG